MKLASQELYEAHRICRSGSAYKTESGVLVTYGGSANAPHTQFIRATASSLSIQFDGYWCAENIHHALNKFKSHLPIDQ